ncbi:MAG TPA: trypsin-like peptidase domain-containing protein [Kofleriaceae bacterium]|nr:trypsin-like peptidase domain-containing protein [Kofleriaceae bacterium]
MSSAPDRARFVLAACLAACSGANTDRVPSSASIIQAAVQAAVRVRATGDLAQASGSGFFVRAGDGSIYVVTNHHVVWGATAVTVERSDGIQDTARVLATDPATDLALLHPALRSAPATLAFGDDAALRQGDWICALGSPGGVFNAASAGIVSARGTVPDAAVAGERLVDHLFIDAVVGPGNSGGPVIDSHGRVVGVIAATLGNRGLGIAVPGHLAAAVLQQLAVDGRATHATLGMQVGDGSLERARGTGVRVTEVVAGGAADLAHIQIGDRVLTVDGQPVPPAAALGARAFGLAAGTVWRVELLRDGQRITRTIALRDLGDHAVRR